MIEEKLLADTLLSIGTLIGILTKADALQNQNTQWPRRSSGLNILTYPVTGLLPYFLLDLWIAFTTTLLTVLIWIGIFIYRPEKQGKRQNMI